MAAKKRKRRSSGPREPRKPAAVRDAELRENLEPLAPGERPRPLVVAAVIAALIGVTNIVLYLAGYQVRDREPTLGGTLLVVGVMLTAAAGMWQRQYWAVLGFQALLAITVLFASVALMTASNLYAAVLCVVLIGGAGTLFYALIRTMARLQMPQR
jgi:lipoprotein signal peptidase